MARATIAYSGMERAWYVWPGGGQPSLRYTDAASAEAARAALDAGRPVAAKAAAKPSDPSDFLPSRSTPRELYDLALAASTSASPRPERPMPKTPGRAKALAAARPPKSSKTRKPIDIPAARRVYAETGSLMKTAARFGVGFETLRRQFRRAGVKINPAVKPQRCAR